MKRTLSVLALAAFSLLATLTLVHTSSGKHVLRTDGVPAPPWPKPVKTLLKDGVPAPPWPKLGHALQADGVPAPPWPVKKRTITLAAA